MKSVLRVLAGEAVWPPPIWLMRQAGRYLPEYRTLRAQAGDFLTLCTTPLLAAEVTMQPLRRYNMDAAILFSDILVLPWALGQDLRFEQGEGPVLAPIRTEEDFSWLDRKGAPAYYAPVIETVRLLRGQVGNAALIGFAGAPFTVACYMVEGAGSKDFAIARGLAYAQPALFAKLIDFLVDATTTYLAAQAEAGAEVLMLFDSWAGLLPPNQFCRHVIEPTARIVEGLRERCPGVPVIGFPRLAGTLLRRYAAETGVQGMALDTGVDPACIRPDHVALQGNLDPLALLAGGPAMQDGAAAILQAARGRPWVFNLGHGIVPATPPEHVAQLVGQVRAG